MKEIFLDFGDLKMTLIVTHREIEASGGPYQDWLTCNVSVSIRTFTGSFIWSIMPEELLIFSNKLSALYDQFPNQDKVEFESMEPNVSFVFTVGSRGELTVDFSLKDTFVNPVCLNSSYETDQNVLKDLSSKLRRFAESITGEG